VGPLGKAVAEIVAGTLPFVPLPRRLEVTRQAVRPAAFYFCTREVAGRGSVPLLSGYALSPWNSPEQGRAHGFTAGSESLTLILHGYLCFDLYRGSVLDPIGSKFILRPIMLPIDPWDPV